MKVVVYLVLTEGSSGQELLTVLKCLILVQISVLFSALSQELGDDAIRMVTGETLLSVDVPSEAKLSKVFCLLK